MLRVRIPKQACENCGRQARTGLNRPHSLHHTKRLVLLNLQRKGGRLLCTRCLRTLRLSAQAGKKSAFTQKVAV